MFQSGAKMTSIVADLVHGYRDLMDNKSGETISFLHLLHFLLLK